ncbi:MAG: methylated-DNA--[protein]-cysteine S-methyltransferase [Roseateles sp.]
MNDTAAAIDGPLWAHSFDTALGRCGIVWSGQGVVASLLPEAPPERLARLHPRAQLVQDLPPAIAHAVAGIRALLAGELCDLSDVLLDERGIPEFRRRVHALTRAIPPGQTRTYGQIAAALGQPGAARAVGRAEGDNPFAPIVPCHRLLLIEARAVGQLAGDQQPLF